MCETVRYEDWSWEQQVQDDISVGAPESAARSFTRVVRTQLCPHLFD